jgi:hypothetical protein
MRILMRKPAERRLFDARTKKPLATDQRLPGQKAV